MSTFSYTLGDAIPSACAGGVVTIGNFDGVHLGHQALLGEAARQARAAHVAAVAVTFDPPPSRLLRPDQAGPLLLTIEDRAALLHQHGAHHVLIVNTSLALLELRAREFFERILVSELRVKALVEGFNFGFGKNREGTTEVLHQYCSEKAIGLTLMPPQELLGAPVSSSRVRAELLAGRVDVAATLLGRLYRIHGIVGTGQRRGATLGFPTANLHDLTTLLPGNGVYAVRALVDGVTWPAAANLGPNPTFGEHARKVEVHLLGFRGDLYGKPLVIEFVQKLRDTRPFANVEELKRQIEADIASAKAILAAGV